MTERVVVIMSLQSEKSVPTTQPKETPRLLSRKEALALGAAAAAATAIGPAVVAEAASAGRELARVTASPVTLTFINRYSDKIGLPAATALFTKFTKETGITIKDDYQPNSGATYQPAVRTAFASSTPPDLASDIAGPEIYNLARAGVIRDISDFYRTSIRSRATAAATTGAALDGKVWGLSNGASVGNILWYNPDYLKKYGLDGSSVRTWSGWLRQLQAIKKGGGTPIVLGAKDLWPGGHYLTDLVQRTLGDQKTAALYNRTVVPGSPATPKWTDPAVVKAFQMLVDLIPYFQPGFPGEAQATADALFLSGQAGWYEMGSWFTNTILAQKPSFTPGMILFPAIEGYPGSQRQVTIANDIIVASKKSPYWDEIKKWYLFMTRPDNARFWSQSNHTAMPYTFDARGLSVEPAIKPIFSKVLGFLSNAGPDGAVLFNDEAVDVNMYTKYIWQGSTALFSNALTAQALCAQLEAATEAFQKGHR